MKTSIRKYNGRKDKKSAQRIWQECGWLSDEKREKEAMDLFVKVSRPMVYDMDGSAECLVFSTPGSFMHSGTELDLAAITGVTTSRIARNQGAASYVLAKRLAEDAQNGAHVSGLGIFEQGFYDRLGYGSGPYENWISFDPAWLTDLPKPPVPVRLSVENAEEIHKARLARRMLHGAVSLIPSEITKAEMTWDKNTFGLGYRDGDGKLTHFLVMRGKGENGPYTVDWMVCRSLADFKELLAILSGLGDQVRQVKMREPRDVQLQDFLKKPFQLFSISDKGKYETKNSAVSYWQMRILDLESCVAVLKTRDELTFNLVLNDPIEHYLPEGSTWRGCSGEYVVRLGERSSIEPGTRTDVETLTASVNTFSRYWMGSLSAEALSISGVFEAPASLIEELDAVRNWPSPYPDWDY